MFQNVVSFLTGPWTSAKLPHQENITNIQYFSTLSPLLDPVASNRRNYKLWQICTVIPQSPSPGHFYPLLVWFHYHHPTTPLSEKPLSEHHVFVHPYSIGLLLRVKFFIVLKYCGYKSLPNKLPAMLICCPEIVGRLDSCKSMRKKDLSVHFRSFNLLQIGKHWR